MEPLPEEETSFAVSLIAPASLAALLAARSPSTVMSPSTVSTAMPAFVPVRALDALTLPTRMSFLSLSATYVPVRVWFTETLPPKSFATFSATISAVASSAAVPATSTTPCTSILPAVASASRLPPAFTVDLSVESEASVCISVPERVMSPADWTIVFLLTTTFLVAVAVRSPPASIASVSAAVAASTTRLPPLASSVMSPPAATFLSAATVRSLTVACAVKSPVAVTLPRVSVSLSTIAIAAGFAVSVFLAETTLVKSFCAFCTEIASAALSVAFFAVTTPASVIAPTWSGVPASAVTTRSPEVAWTLALSATLSPATSVMSSDARSFLLDSVAPASPIEPAVAVMTMEPCVAVAFAVRVTLSFAVTVRFLSATTSPLRVMSPAPVVSVEAITTSPTAAVALEPLLIVPLATTLLPEISIVPLFARTAPSSSRSPVAFIATDLSSAVASMPIVSTTPLTLRLPCVVRSTLPPLASFFAVTDPSEALLASSVMFCASSTIWRFGPAPVPDAW